MRVLFFTSEQIPDIFNEFFDHLGPFGSETVFTRTNDLEKKVKETSRKNVFQGFLKYSVERKKVILKKEVYQVLNFRKITVKKILFKEVT